MNQGLYTLILCSYYSENKIESVYKKIKERFAVEEIDFEFIIVDDGSKDNSFKVASELEKKESNVRAYQLSHNFTAHYSKFAGFTLAKGDIITSMPDDWQTPIDMYVRMYREWQKGAKSIIPYRNKRQDGFITDFFAKSYYFVMNKLSDINLPPLGADVFAIDRELVDIINARIHPINTSTLIEVLRLGFDPLYIPYERPKSEVSKSRWTFKKKVKLAKDTFFSSSSFPIKFITFLGTSSFLFSIFLIILSIIYKIWGTESLGGFSIPGWTSTLIFISLFSGLILFSLGIIAEYIWRIYEEVKDRPGYIIKKKEDNIKS